MVNSSSQLSAATGPKVWDNLSTTAFGDRSSALAILPIYGMCDHGLGLSLDIEEVIGGALLTASAAVFPTAQIRILPPLRADLSPYRFSPVKTDPENFLEMIQEIAAGVEAAGFDRLVFWTTSPWNAEIVDVASRDIRIGLNLKTFVIELSGLGLSLHPRSSDRERAQILGGTLTQTTPESVAGSDPSDSDFRPGNWSRLPAVIAGATEAPEAIFDRSAQALAALLQEVHERCNNAPSGEDASIELRHFSIPAASYPGPRRPQYLASSSAQKLEEADRKSETLVVIPIGAIEQHGPHLPVGVDSMIAEAAAAGLSQRLPESIVCAPTLCYSKSNEHHDYPGTLSLSARTLRRFLKSQIQALHEAGYRQFAVLNTHGGNSSVLTYTLRELQVELKIRAGMLRLPSTPDLDPHESTWGFHAGEWETSVMLEIAPHTVDMDRAICHYPVPQNAPGKLRPENAPAIFSWKTRDIAPDGVMGDATKATAEKGKQWLETALDQVAEQIRELLQRE
ncbi:MAG: hypothetical protein SynsKO_24740 [Synoicihabitans sp.]